MRLFNRLRFMQLVLGAAICLHAQAPATIEKKASISTKEGQWTFRATGDGHGNAAKVEIFDSAGALIQTLRPQAGIEWSMGGPAELFEFQDLDFDGCLDLEICDQFAGSGNEWFSIYRFDSVRRRFTFSAELSELCRPRALPDEKVVFEHMKGGGMTYGDSRYAWIHGRLVEIERERDDGRTWTVWERRGGKLVRTLRKKSIQAPD